MTIEYEETTRDLQTRIDIHQRYGSKDIDQWMLEILQPAKGSKILDVGCGSGKQLVAFHKHLEGEAEITGGDINDELLAEAKLRNAEFGDPWSLMTLDFDKRFDVADDTYDIETCCFALYYANEPGFTIAEMRRVLAPGGRLFTTGPMPENKRLFYDIIAEATGKEIPPMPGSSRYGGEFLQEIRDQFSSVEVHVFENPLEFDSVEPFLDYTRASLSEDRKLWNPFFGGDDDLDRVMEAIESVSRSRLQAQDNLIMTKVVGGFVAAK